MMRLPLFSLFVLLAACSAPETRYLINTPSEEATQTVRLRVSTIELREVSLPTYADDTQILLEGADGALSPQAGAIWAEAPARAMTMQLADQISQQSNATAAAEPWPLETPAQVAVHVRVSQMIARADGEFDLKGQFAISSYDKIVRERIERFEFSVPLTGANPQAISQASGAATQMLGQAILRALAR